MDPLSDVLSLLKLKSYMSGGFDAGGDWAIAFGKHDAHASVLLAMLPPVVHLHQASDKAVLRWCVERMRDELRTPQPGGSLIAQQLATTMLIHALRLHLAEATKADVGWLYALADARMSTAIAAMHEAPSHRWTLQSLAERAGMSRTSFAVRFKETVGESPLGYLTRWRMLLAGERLATTDDSISVLAGTLGYESESAFSTAFKREMGCSPRQYARGSAAPPPKRV